MATIRNNEELVEDLEFIDREMIADPRVKTVLITDEKYYHWRSPFYTRKYRILKENGKV